MSLRLLIVFALAATGFARTASAQEWKAAPLEDGASYAASARDPRPAAPSGIPHMRMAQGKGDIVAAWYAQPTSRYRHGVLGDAIEGGTLVARLANGREVRHRLPESEVFEDIAPRIADLDGDGSNEVVTILSSLTAGAAVAVFRHNGGALVRAASTAHIGRANRWLNIAGIARFTGDRTPEIAIVTTPHIGGRLAFLKYSSNSIVRFNAGNGYSNHVIGSPELRLAATGDVNGDGRADLALPSADRRALRIVGFTAQGLEELGRAELPAAIDKPVIIREKDGKTAFAAGAEDGKVYGISR